MHPTALRIADACLLMRVRRLARATTRIYTAQMRSVGLSVGQFTLLTAIGVNEGARASDLGPALDMDGSTVSRELAALVNSGLVRTDRLDGRSHTLHLTDEGAQRLAAAEAAWLQAQAQARTVLGPLADGLIDHFAAR